MKARDTHVVGLAVIIGMILYVAITMLIVANLDTLAMVAQGDKIVYGLLAVMVLVLGHRVYTVISRPTPQRAVQKIEQV